MYGINKQGKHGYEVAENAQDNAQDDIFLIIDDAQDLYYDAQQLH